MNPSSAPTSVALDSPINPGLQAVIELFDTELLALKFPDVDHAVLREAAAKVLTQAEAVAAAELALATAREALGDAQEALLGKCQRALAYARVYAEEDRELSRWLEAINLSRPCVKAVPVSSFDAVELWPGRCGCCSVPTSGLLFVEPIGTLVEDVAGVDSCVV